MSSKEDAEDIVSGMISDAVERKESEASKLDDKMKLSTSHLSVIGTNKIERQNGVKR